MPNIQKIRVREIGDNELDRVVAILARGFRKPTRVFWSRITRLAAHPTPSGFPRYGYILENGEMPVGVILTIFSAVKDGQTSAVRCGVASWYVEPAFRSYANALVAKVFAHKGVTFMNVSPARHTWPALAAQGYTRYNQGIYLSVPALHHSIVRTQATIIGADQEPAASFMPYERDLIKDHAAFGCLSFWCATPERAYPFVFRLCSANRIPAFAHLIYCTNIDIFVLFAGQIGKFLLKYGRPFALVDANGPIPKLAGKFLNDKMPKFYRGPHQPRFGDLAYTELALFDNL